MCREESSINSCIEVYYYYYYSLSYNSIPIGSPSIHYELSKSLRDLKDYKSSCDHYIYSNHPEEFSEMIYEWCNKENCNEIINKEIYVLREILKYLTIENIRDSKIFLKNIKLVFEKNNIRIENDVVINLCEYLIECVQRDAKPLFELLKEKYSKIFEIDPSFNSVFIYLFVYYIILK